MVTHPRLEYLLVATVAAVVCFVLTPVARWAAIKIGAVAAPRDRDVHAVAIPRMGGVAMFFGLAAGLFVASRLPTLSGAFGAVGPNMVWVVGAGALICALGVLDDSIELDSVTKLAGQVLATSLLVTLGGVQLVLIYIPGSTLSAGSELGIPVTVLLMVLTINALNFVDGLDGLAAGITAISAVALFVFSLHLSSDSFQDVAAAPTLLAAVLAGACLGFLPFNFFPAKIFMGDSGSMLLGMVLSATAVSLNTTADPQAFNHTLGVLPLYLPLIIPLAVFALPLIDLLLAVVRRVRHGRSPFSPDKQHLHHRLLEMGHSHRRSVVLLYLWSGLIAFLGVGLSFEHRQALVGGVVGGLAAIAIVLSVVPPQRLPLWRSRPAARAARSASLAGPAAPAGSTERPADAPPPDRPAGAPSESAESGGVRTG